MCAEFTIEGSRQNVNNWADGGVFKGIFVGMQRAASLRGGVNNFTPVNVERKNAVDGNRLS